MREAVNSFLNYLIVEKGFSENTAVAYRNDLCQLVSFAEEGAGKRGLTPSWASFGRQEMLSSLLTCCKIPPWVTPIGVLTNWTATLTVISLSIEIS